MVKQRRIQDILNEIQRQRKRMIETAKINGLTSDETIRQSQKLDRLIYEYQCMYRRTSRRKRVLRVGRREMMFVLPGKRFTLKKVHGMQNGIHAGR